MCTGAVATSGWGRARSLILNVTSVHCSGNEDNLGQCTLDIHPSTMFYRYSQNAAVICESE